jgi:hypothetical protein
VSPAASELCLTALDYVSVYASRSFNLNKFGRSAGYFVIEKQTNEMFWVDTERNKPKQAVILSSKCE